MLIKIFNIILLACFILSAAVQFNDPDPLSWILMYGTAAFACILFAAGRLPLWLPALIGSVALAWIIYLLPGAIRSPEPVSGQAVFSTVEMINERVEVIREIGGLLITGTWMIVLYIAGKRPS